MRLLTVTNCPTDPDLGSGKTVVRNTGRLRELGHEVDILEPGDYEISRGMQRASRIRKALGAYVAVGRRLDRASYDVVEFYGAEFWPTIVRLSRRRVRPLLVAHTNGLELLDLERERDYQRETSFVTTALRDLYNPLLKLSFTHTDAFVSLCEADRRYVIDRGYYAESRAAVIGPGLDDEFLDAARQPMSARQDRVSFVGSWIPRKGSGTVPIVMNRVLAERHSTIFDVFGTPDRDAVVSAFDPRVRDRVVVHPRLDRRTLAERLSLGKVFFFPTQYEGYGLATLEAMACGLVPVTTPTGLGAELTSELGAVWGFDDVEGMYRSIVQLLDDDRRRAQVAGKGREFAGRQEWSRSGDAIAAQYSKWLDAR